ncbi:hypothetical protein F2Q68_00000633 [Brassica cretica]|uniref:Conserved oligomeric Golgi complex subunit 2 n=1 Tax=Brassica cretica TaxID=69181 RepID=A0A8S9J6N7_BRACR|nr:hypothetical protein F2Q68_00000633 [Brassica cretica]
MSDPVATLPSPRSAADVFWDDSRPLWFNPSLFISPVFDSESFISDLRTFVPFDTLRSELRSHLSSRNRELLDHINRDYADFANLSTKLVDIDATAGRMRAPLLELREEINEFRGSVEAARVARAIGLNQRCGAADAREVLESSLDAFRVVSKVEKLIQQQQDGASTTGTQSRLLERIAGELNRLKFHMNLPFTESLEKRIQSASVLFDASLRNCFIDGINNRDSKVLYNCLRAYAATDNTKNAEEIFRTTIVAPFIHKVIAHEAYAGTSGDELENDYRQIKHFFSKDCKMLLEISSTVSEVRGDYIGHISHYLSSCSSEVLDLVRKSMLQGVESLDNVLPLVKKTIIEVIVDKSVEELSQLKGIAATCMMSNKPVPIRHSPYVVGLLRPLKAFLEGDKARHYLTHETREELLLGTLTEMTRRYYELAAGRLSDARKTETYLQKSRQNAQKRAGAAASGVTDHNVSGTEKMCMQLFLDLQEYGRNICALGLNPADIEPYCSLWKCVAPPDRQNTISV